MEITAGRDWAVGESGKNSTTRLAEPLAIVDSVAFRTGESSDAIDEDFYSVVADGDSTVRVELAHFDPANNNFDLQLLDVDDNTLALSNSTDSFESAEVTLLDGETLYIRIVPINVAVGATYTLNVDLN